MTMQHVDAARVRAQIVAILTAWEMDPALIETTANVMIATDLSGVDSHGVSMLMDYDASRTKGKLNVKAKPRVVRENAVKIWFEKGRVNHENMIATYKHHL